MPYTIIITDAGVAEITNAENNGLDPIVITQVAFGTGQYTASASATDLQNETTRLTTVSGTNISESQIHVSVIDDNQSANYQVSEIGFYSDAGTLVAIYADTSPFLEKTVGSALMVAMDLSITTVQATSISFGDTNFSNPPATETQAGIAPVATQTETNIGINDSKMITPKKLKESQLALNANALRGSGSQISLYKGDGSREYITIGHLYAETGKEDLGAVVLARKATVGSSIDHGEIFSGDSLYPVGFNVDTATNSIESNSQGIVESLNGTWEALGECAAVSGKCPCTLWRKKTNP